MAAKDSKRLADALAEAGASEIQGRMAAILLAVNGIANALSFVAGVKRLNRLAGKMAATRPPEPDEEGEEYAASELIPLPAKCGKCKRVFIGADAILAPSLKTCRCFWCHGHLKPHPDFEQVVDAETMRRDAAAQKPKPVQRTLFEEEEA